MKRLLALLLAILMTVTLFAACGDSDSGSDDSGKSTKITKNDGEDEDTDDSDSGDTADADAEDDSRAGSNLASSFDGASDVSYVMIYNPDVYDEEAGSTKTLSTGKLSKWIDTSVSRADGLDEEPEVTKIAQNDPFQDVSDIDANTDGDRAGGIQPTYKVNDKHDFYYNIDLSSNKSKSDSFTCIYAGDKCYVWTLSSDNVNKKDAESIGKEFDDKIYDKDVSTFGTPRYADEGGKIHLLFHAMNGSVYGYFSQRDLFSSSEVTASESKKYYVNLDHAIIHINSGMISKSSKTLVYSTIAHEFQHLINFSDAFYNKDLESTSTWLNEAMSGYAEETNYPGTTEEQKYSSYFSKSTLYRGGHSLYNFTNDIGDYAYTYMFTEYLAKNSGSDVFKKIHEYWRKKYTSSTDDAESIQKSVSSSYSSKIDKLISYPSSMKFKSKAQEWMSKMTLDFYISAMKYDSSDPKAFKNIKATDMLYDQVNAAKLEGGGRIVFATKDGKFSIPDDADSNLVYVGFDKNFKQVTKPIFK